MTPVDMSPPATRAQIVTVELRQRILSGIVLAALAIGFDYAGPLPFAALVTFVAAMVAWEWSGLVRARGVDAALLVSLGSLVLATILTALGFAAFGLIAVIAGAIAVVPLSFGARPYLTALGVLYSGVPAVSLLWLHGSAEHGFLAILFLYLVVWGTDTAAFISGKSLGGPKLWPQISPKKTWSGLIGGIVGAVLAALLLAVFVPGIAMVELCAKAALLALVSQAGDLAESALKRAFNAKDSSNLIPGHGGFLDRLDGFVTAATLAGVIALVTNVQAPARALLFGH